MRGWLVPTFIVPRGRPFVFVAPLWLRFRERLVFCSPRTVHALSGTSVKRNALPLAFDLDLEIFRQEVKEVQYCDTEGRSMFLVPSGQNPPGTPPPAPTDCLSSNVGTKGSFLHLFCS